MASAGNSLSEEFDCPICLDEVTNPKIMGPCHHTACFECVVDLIRTSDREGVFSCPVCREDCPVPAGGVKDLKDDFKLKAIMDRYKNVQENTAGIKCSVCKNPASHFCERCERIFLCPPCAKKHDLNPDTADHELIGICKEDGKTLSRFCRGCNQAICSVCRIAKHSSGRHHDVTSHEEVVDEETKAVVDEIDRLGRKLARKEQYTRSLQDIHVNFVAKVETNLNEVKEKAQSAIVLAERNRVALVAERRNLQEQMEAIAKLIAVTDNKLDKNNKMMKDIRAKKDEYCQVIGDQRDKRLVNLNLEITQVTTEMSEIQDKLDLGRAETTGKRVLDDRTVPNLVHIREELEKLSMAAEQDDDVDPFLDIENRMVRFVPDEDDMEIGRLVGKMLKYTSAEKVADLSYPPDRPSCVVWSLKHRDDGRVVSLYQSHDDHGAGDTICLHDTTSPGESLMTITRNIKPAIDMTITSIGEVMVLRWTEPVVRAFNMDTGTFRNIDVCFGDKWINRKLGIEADDEGNIFVLNGDITGTNIHLLVFNTEGNLIYDVKIGRAIRMAYCRSKRVLFIAAGDRIVRYQWNGSMLTQMSPLPHGVENFRCFDVCIGSAGEVFVAGLMTENHEIRIYQVMKAEEDRREEEGCGAGPGSVEQSGNVSSRDVGDEANETIKMIRINFSDNILRLAKEIPCISVKDNTLVLGFQSKVVVFKLL